MANVLAFNFWTMSQEVISVECFMRVSKLCNSQGFGIDCSADMSDLGCAWHADGDKPRTGKIAELYVYDNFARVPAETVMAGDICALTGLSDVTIGETVCDKDQPSALPTITVSRHFLTLASIAPYAPDHGVL